MVFKESIMLPLAVILLFLGFIYLYEKVLKKSTFLYLGKGRHLMMALIISLFLGLPLAKCGATPLEFWELIFSWSLVVLGSYIIYLSKWHPVHAHLFILGFGKLLLFYTFLAYSLLFLEAFLSALFFLEDGLHYLLESFPPTLKSFFQGNFLAHCAGDRITDLAYFQSPAGQEAARAILEECPAAHDIIEIMGWSAAHINQINQPGGPAGQLDDPGVTVEATGIFEKFRLMLSPRGALPPGATSAHILTVEMMKPYLQEGVEKFIRYCPQSLEALQKVHDDVEFANKFRTFCQLPQQPAGTTLSWHMPAR